MSSGIVMSDAARMTIRSFFEALLASRILNRDLSLQLSLFGRHFILCSYRFSCHRSFRFPPFRPDILVQFRSSSLPYLKSLYRNSYSGTCKCSSYVAISFAAFEVALVLLVYKLRVRQYQIASGDVVSEHSKGGNNQQSSGKC